MGAIAAVKKVMASNTPTHSRTTRSLFLLESGELDLRLCNYPTQQRFLRYYREPLLLHFHQRNASQSDRQMELTSGSRVVAI